MAGKPVRHSAIRPPASNQNIGISEFASEVQGALSPFGSDLRLPMPVELLHYRHPGPEDRPHLVVDQH